MSQSIPTGYIRPGNPRGLGQKYLPGGRDLTFESCPGAGNSTRAGISWKMKLKLKKKIQSFTGENTKTKKKTSRIFDLFARFICFFNIIFPGLWVNFLVLLSHIPKSEELPLACLFKVFTGLWLLALTFCIKTYDYVKHFVRVLVL